MNGSDNSALLPCPFCGNDKHITIDNERDDNSGGYFIACPKCDASTGLRYACGEDPRPLLIEQWNRRAQPPHSSGQDQAVTIDHLPGTSGDSLEDAMKWAAGSGQDQDARDAARYFSFEFEVWQDDMMVASAIGTREDAQREAMHYAAQYAEDGPVRVFEVVRTLVAAMAQPKDTPSPDA